MNKQLNFSPSHTGFIMTFIPGMESRKVKIKYRSFFFKQSSFSKSLRKLYSSPVVLNTKGKPVHIRTILAAPFQHVAFFTLKALRANESYNFKPHKEISKVSNTCSSNSALRKGGMCLFLNLPSKLKIFSHRLPFHRTWGPLVIRQLWSCLCGLKKLCSRCRHGHGRHSHLGNLRSL